MVMECHFCNQTIEIYASSIFFSKHFKEFYRHNCSFFEETIYVNINEKQGSYWFDFRQLDALSILRLFDNSAFFKEPVSIMYELFDKNGNVIYNYSTFVPAQSYVRNCRQDIRHFLSEYSFKHQYMHFIINFRY